MIETAETIRQQMDETKFQLSDKLESLELQVSETVQQTGAAVNTTVAAVQETVESVTEGFRDAAQSVTNAFDLRLQIERHPWIVVGGSFVLGYFLNDLLSGSPRNPIEVPELAPARFSTLPNRENVSGEDASEFFESPANAINSAETTDPSWYYLRNIMLGTVLGIAQEAALRAVPHVLDFLTNGRGNHSGQSGRHRG
jgi:hypothetical protein